jgi:xanthine phosphoribosyltransferase
MDLLKNYIKEHGKVLPNNVLKVDSFLNHQVDPQLMMEMGKELAGLFREEPITKVLTIESSGIAVALVVALELKCPLLFARKKKSVTMDDVYAERVPSFTKGIVTDITVSKTFLTAEDHVLVIDDFIANGDTSRGLLKIIERAGASLAGFGIVIEKSFQAGGRTLRDRGIRVESLAKIASLDNSKVTFED